MPPVPDAASAAQPPAAVKSRALRNALVIAATMLVLAGLGVGGWYGYSKIIIRGGLPSGLVIHLAFDNSTDDSSGNGLNGIGHEITYATGKTGQAAVFNGRGSYVTVPDSAALNLTGPFTLVAWFKFDVGGNWNPRIFHKGNSYQIYTIGLGSVRNLEFSCTAGGVTGPAVRAGQWTHVAGVFDGTAVILYVNGALVGQSPGSGPLEVNQDDLTIGRNAEQGTDFFKGAINEAQIYKRALSAREIQSIYQAGGAGKP